MKTFLVILAIAAIVALNEAKPGGRRGGGPGGSRGGPGGRRPGGRGPRGPRGLLEKICNIVFADGTTKTRDCFKANGLFDCQKIDLAELPRLPRSLQDATEISLCLPVQCSTDSDCSSIDDQSECVDGLPKPDEETKDEIKALMESCMPRRQRPGAGRRRPGADDEDDDDQTPPAPFLSGRSMCSIPPSYFVASRACRVEDEDGTDIKTKECKARRGETVSCNATSACEVEYQGRDVKLHFCEKPERPERPQGGNNGSGQLGGNNGNGNGRPGNRPGNGSGRRGNGRRGNRGGDQNPGQNGGEP